MTLSLFHTETPAMQKKAPYPQEFEADWRSYPTSPIMSKKAAYEKWKRLDAEDRAAFRAAIPKYKAYLKQPENAWLHPCHLVVFINQRRWEAFAEDASHITVDEDRWLKRLAYARKTKQWDSKAWDAG